MFAAFPFSIDPLPLCSVNVCRVSFSLETPPLKSFPDLPKHCQSLWVSAAMHACTEPCLWPTRYSGGPFTFLSLLLEDKQKPRLNACSSLAQGLAVLDTQ